MVLVALEIIVLFAALLVVLTFYSNSIGMIIISGVLALVIGWGLISWQLNNKFMEVVCLERTTTCVVNLSALYENPSQNKELIRLNKITGLNIKWGWLIWSAFFTMSYGLAWVVRTNIR
jgi:hypothetical protein